MTKMFSKTIIFDASVSLFRISPPKRKLYAGLCKDCLRSVIPPNKSALTHLKSCICIYFENCIARFTYHFWDLPPRSSVCNVGSASSSPRTRNNQPFWVVAMWLRRGGETSNVEGLQGAVVLQGHRQVPRPLAAEVVPCRPAGGWMPGRGSPPEQFGGVGAILRLGTEADNFEV